MDTAEIRRRVVQRIAAARAEAAARRTRGDEAAREFDELLERIAVPLFRQIAGALKAAGFSFGVFTPSGSVRLMSDTRAQDYIELGLDTSGAQPAVVATISYSRGRRVIETERIVAEGPVRELTEEQLATFVVDALTPFVEK